VSLNALSEIDSRVLEAVASGRSTPRAVAEVLGVTPTAATTRLRKLVVLGALKAHPAPPTGRRGRPGFAYSVAAPPAQEAA
jgi:predicted ArsR family transcriptional regulator